jgi:hypothetical protein
LKVPKKKCVMYTELRTTSHPGAAPGRRLTPLFALPRLQS